MPETQTQPTQTEPTQTQPTQTQPTPFSPDGVHLLRTTQQIQYQLSQMADQKASMLLGITFVIFTIAVGQARVAAPQPALLVLGAAAFGAALSATKTPPIGGPNDNILFFGVFAQIPQEEYVERLLSTVTDTRAIYEAFAHDIYQNGAVLAGKKYRLLGYAYRVLLAGLVLSFLAFVAPLAMRLVGR
jgi:hypothetical protein